ncbi:MAG: LPXTG cell wall anchor domain-containing protein [Candidatus Nanopelagicales bacterium]
MTVTPSNLPKTGGSSPAGLLLAGAGLVGLGTIVIVGTRRRGTHA